MVHIANNNKRGKYKNAKSGHFYMQHPEKFCGTELPIYKSNLERMFMQYADKNPAIIQWGYENCFIKYLDRSTNPAKVRRYFIDFVCKIKIGNIIKTVWIEIKQSDEVNPPRKNSSPKTILTWIKNTSKWDAARQLAKSKGYDFKILTEKELS